MRKARHSGFEEKVKRVYRPEFKKFIGKNAGKIALDYLAKIKPKK